MPEFDIFPRVAWTIISPGVLFHSFGVDVRFLFELQSCESSGLGKEMTLSAVLIPGVMVQTMTRWKSYSTPSELMIDFCICYNNASPADSGNTFMPLVPPLSGGMEIRDAPRRDLPEEQTI